MKRIVSEVEKLARDLVQIKKDEDTRFIFRNQEEARKAISCLLVEDDIYDSEMASIALQAMGAEVKVAKSGEKALEMLQNSMNPVVPDFQIVFLDMKLTGGINGEEVLKFIRNRFPKLHVVIVTGALTLDEIQDLAKKYGYFGIVTKPLEKMDVREIFEKHRLWPN